MACAALFNDLCFLLAFLPLTLLAYWAFPSGRWKLLVIVVSGAAFYALWDVRFVALLAGAAVVDFALARAMATSRVPRAWLVASITFNLGILAIFKYAMFAAESARSLLSIVGSDATVPYFHIVLPVGISFFTFKSMSYTIDVYRGEVAPSRDLLHYMAFICLFADMVAGPIIRYRDMATQMAHLPREPGEADWVGGLSLLGLGLAKKVLIADSIAAGIDPLWSQWDSLSTLGAWTAVVGFAVQLYFDFSGYSDMALGLGRMLGLRLPANFNAPYQATSPADFWRRWHISLSTWLRDYLYIPLGGSRQGAWRARFNLMLVMVLGGLWHGANETFILWGAYHGAWLVVYHKFRPEWDAMPAWLQRGTTLLIVVTGWAFFRADGPRAAFTVLGSMAGVGSGAVAAGLILLGTIGALLLLLQFARPVATWSFPARRRWAVALGALIGLTLIAAHQQQSPFLYYQF